MLRRFNENQRMLLFQESPKKWIESEIKVIRFIGLMAGGEMSAKLREILKKRGNTI